MAVTLLKPLPVRPKKPPEPPLDKEALKKKAQELLRRTHRLPTAAPFRPPAEPGMEALAQAQRNIAEANIQRAARASGIPAEELRAGREIAPVGEFAKETFRKVVGLPAFTVRQMFGKEPPRGLYEYWTGREPTFLPKPPSIGEVMSRVLPGTTPEEAEQFFWTAQMGIPTFAGVTGGPKVSMGRVPKKPAIPAPAVAPRPAVAKEAWQMTRAEFDAQAATLTKRYNEILDGMLTKRIKGEIDYNSPVYRNTTQDALRQLKKDLNRPDLDFGVVQGAGHEGSVRFALQEGKPVPSSVLAEYPDLAKAAPAKAVVPPAGEVGRAAEAAELTGEEVLERLFRNLALSRRNKVERVRFLEDSIRPAIKERFGDSPVMELVERQRVEGVMGGERETLLAVSTAGWRTRLDEMGLKFVRKDGFNDLYRLPSAEIAPRSLPQLLAPKVEAAAPAPPAAEGVTPPPPRKPPVVETVPPAPLAPGKRLMGDLADFNTTVEVATRPDVARRIANLPGIRNISGILNPSSVADTSVKQALIGRAMLRAEGQTKATGAFQSLAQLGSEAKVFGAVDAQGRLASGPLKGLALNDIRTYPGRYAGKLTEAQKAWIKAANTLETDKLDFLKRNGIKVGELTFDEGGQYAGRRVYGKFSPEGELLDTGFVSAGPGRPGRKLTVERERVFATAEDAIKAGYKYLPEEETLRLNMIAAYNRVADKKMTDWLLQRIPWRTTRKAEGGPLLKVGEAAVQAPAFAGKILTGAEARETAQLLNKSFAPEFNNALAAVNKANALFRFYQLAGDASPATIQLIFLAGENPRIYGKALGGFTRALFDTNFHAKYLAKHNDTIQRARGLILARSGTEFTEALAKGGLLRRQPLRLFGKVLEPFQRGFEVALDIAGIEMREALEHLATTPERAAQVDAFVNEFRGLANSARIGVSPLERQLETAAILAPRYNRAIAALLTDTVRGNLRGELARKALAKGVAAIVAMAVAVSYARGEDFDEIVDHLIPGSPRFFTWKVGNQNVGPGSKVRSVAVLFAKSIKDPTALGDLRVTYTRNPLTRFVRGNLSPVISDGLDLLTGKNYIGDPTREGLLDFAKTMLAPSLMPIWVQTAALEGGDMTGRVTRAVSEFLGGRAYPRNLILEARDKWGKDIKPYLDIPSAKELRIMKEEIREKGLSEADENAELDALAEKYPVTAAQYREDNPEVDARLFILGEVSSLKPGEAFDIVVRLLKENNLTVKDIMPPEKGESDAKKELRSDLEEAFGVPPEKPPVNVIPTVPNPALQRAREKLRLVPAGIR